MMTRFDAKSIIQIKNLSASFFLDAPLFPIMNAIQVRVRSQNFIEGVFIEGSSPRRRAHAAPWSRIAGVFSRFVDFGARRLWR
jgi:hypothetical protein